MRWILTPILLISLAARKMRFKLLVSQNKWKEVGRYADDALQRPDNPTLVDLLYSRADRSYLLTMKAKSQAHENNTNDAIITLNSAIEYNEKNSEAYIARAETYLKLKNKSGAKRDLEKARKLGDLQAVEIFKTIQ